jgi:protein SCO1
MQEHGKLRTAGLTICIFLAACGSPRSQNEPQKPREQQAKRYELKGKVVSVDKVANKLVVDHQEIPGFMGAMTMPYPVKVARSLDGLAPGDEVTAQVVVSGNDVWLENIVVVKKGTGEKSAPTG